MQERGGRSKEDLPKILVICGPTASGKTTLAMEIARRRPSEIVSADSRQVYQHLTIGTAKPKPDQLAAVPHHFVDRLPLEAHFSAGDFSIEGRQVIAGILERRKLPLIVGGTGLYIQALVDGLFSGPGLVKELRHKLEMRFDAEGGAALLEELRSVDPASAGRMMPSQRPRIIRALEVYYASGKPLSAHHAEQRRTRLYNPLFVGLRWTRDALYENINRRVDAMFAEGFLDEVKGLLSRGTNGGLDSLRTVGYEEATAFLRGELERADMVDLIKQNTRRYAKRQLTWFGKDSRIRWLDVEKIEEIPAQADRVLGMLDALK